MQADTVEIPGIFPIRSRVSLPSTGQYGTVLSWAWPFYVVALDCGHKVVAPGPLLERAKAHGGWHLEAIVLEGRATSFQKEAT